MRSLSEIKNKAKSFLDKNLNLFPHYNGEPLTISQYIDLYIYSHGINVYSYEKEADNKSVDESLNAFFYTEKSKQQALKKSFKDPVFNEFFNETFPEKKDKESFELRTNYEPIVMSALDFLIWLRLKVKDANLKIKQEKHMLKQSLETSLFLNRVGLSGLEPKDTLQIYLYTYCAMLENFKNIIQSDVLLQILRSELNKGDKKYVMLGDYKLIIEHFDKDSELNELFDKESHYLRNSVYHADFKLLDDGVEYRYENYLKRMDLGRLVDRVVRLGVCLQFFILFYIRIFGTEEENIKI